MPTVYNSASLIHLIAERMATYGPQCSLNDIDVSRVTDFSYVFSSTPLLRQFDGDISQWDTSNAQSMHGMFQGSRFNGDISNWNTSRCNIMSAMFKESAFDGDISRWDVSRVIHFAETFMRGKFGCTQPHDALAAWNIERAHVLRRMFEGSSFNGNLSTWKPLCASRMDAMFKSAAFCQDISMWPLPTESKTLNITNLFANNPAGLAKQSMTPWVLDMLLNECHPIADQKWRLAIKRYELLSKNLGLDPATRYADILAIHQSLVAPSQNAPIEHLDLGMV